MKLVNDLTEIFTTLVEECKGDNELFRVVHIKQNGKDDNKILVNGTTSIKSLVEKVMQQVTHESTLEIKRFGLTQVVLKIM